MQTLIYHNPNCSKSRETLALIRAAGIEPAIVDYLSEPPTMQQLGELIRTAGLAIRDVLRDDSPDYSRFGLHDLSLTDAVVLQAMVEYPTLIQRPLVATPLGVRLCRPPERVFEILP